MYDIPLTQGVPVSPFTTLGKHHCILWSDQVTILIFLLVAEKCVKRGRGECVKSRVHAATAGLSVEYVGP